MRNIARLFALLLLAACGDNKPSSSTVEEIFSDVMALQMAKVNFAYRAAHPRADTIVELEKLKQLYADQITAKQQGECFLDQKDKPTIFNCIIHFEWSDFEVNGVRVPAQSGDTTIQVIQVNSKWQVHQNKPRNAVDLEMPNL